MTSKTIVPRFYELEAFRRSINRKMWAVIGFQGSFCFLCMLLVMYVTMKPVPVIAFDGQGRAMLFEDTVTPREQIEEVRVQYFVESFLGKYAGIDSGNLDTDLSDALNMMTPRLRELAVTDKVEMDRRAKFQDANVRSRIEGMQIKIAPYDPKHSEKLHAIAWGKMVFEPRVGEVGDHENVEQWFFSQLVLLNMPISKAAVFGVLVDYVHTGFYGSEEEMRIERLKRRP